MAAFSEDFRRFAIDLGKFRGVTEQNARAFKQRIAFQILEGVVMKTPVDTGRARGNWQVTLGDVPQEGLELPPNKPGQRTINRGETQILNATFGEDIWIHNNLPYIGVLEDGRVGNKGSDQAPYGMLAVTLAEVESQFR